ncbi:MAG TPA: hypothetical protein VFY41_07320 [Nitrososphaeraceae archaeon]|nr:hypothetical protein [Nitrososphaeraceae archaeon]
MTQEEYYEYFVYYYERSTGDFAIEYSCTCTPSIKLNNVNSIISDIST